MAQGPRPRSFRLSETICKVASLADLSPRRVVASTLTVVPLERNHLQIGCPGGLAGRALAPNLPLEGHSTVDQHHRRPGSCQRAPGLDGLEK